MIESFQLANIASYDATGININNLKEINFFYGANGCGKTTASNYLTDTSDTRFNGCSVQWKGNQPLQSLVYNKAFREKNFGSSDIAGVFTLGEATTEQVEEIKVKKSEFDTENLQVVSFISNLNQQEFQLKSTENDFTEKCWTIYKKYSEDFKEVLRGSLTKKLFKDKLVSIPVTSKELPRLFTHEDLLAKANTLLGDRPDVYLELSMFDPELLINIERDGIWQKVIVGKNDVDIAGMIDALGSHDWVNQGRKYLSDGENCPFCQQATINQVFKAQLEAYFDENFTAEVASVEEISADYEARTHYILSTVYQVLTDEKNNPQSRLQFEEFETHFHTLESQIKSNVMGFKNKIEKVSLVIEVINTQQTLKSLLKIIQSANEKINKHNKLVTDFDNAKANFTVQVWTFLAEQVRDDFKAYNKKIKGLGKAVESLNKNVTQRQEKIEILKKELAELSKNTTSVQPAVDKINYLLKAYGFLNFEIVPSKGIPNHYVIQRENGELALDTLSEGEVTFITFLYFVQLANGALTQEAVTEDRVLVIDDPISSLDSNVLYIVSAIVKELIKEVKDGSAIKQLFLFTHNVYFHKEASFQGGRSNGCNKTHFWILRKANNITGTQSYEQKNPIESSYELLWREIKEHSNNSSITIQNTMRRILENYFKILGKFSDDDIEAKFSNVQEQQTCRSLLYWINDGSHCLPDDLFIQSQDDAIELYLSVFKNIFDYSGHLAHYNMMMGIENALLEVVSEQQNAA